MLGIRVLSVSEQISFWRRSREELRFSERTRGKTALLHISPYANWIHLAAGHARTPVVTNERLRVLPSEDEMQRELFASRIGRTLKSCGIIVHHGLNLAAQRC